MEKIFVSKRMLFLNWHSLKISIVSFLLLFAFFTSYADEVYTAGTKSIEEPQQQVITGTITDSQSGEAMPGVNVVVKRTSVGAISDVNGKYSISVSSPDVTLVFSFIGYVNQEVPLAGRNVVNVALVSDLQQLEEVVVIGYGTMKKSSLTASISKVENKILNQVPTARLEVALQGRFAGVSIQNPRNVPGVAPIIRVRGPGSISASNDPLVVIDGFPGGSLSQLNMNDVLSFEVLKDASSAAIYGSRGAGGVIIVTTKRGSTGAPKLSFNTYAGFSKARLFDDFMVGEEYLDYLTKYQNREFVWAGGDPTIPIWGDPRRPIAYQLNPDVITQEEVIWQDEVAQLGGIQSYNLAVSGGTENVKYYVSGTYTNEDGIMKTTWYKSYFLRANVDVKVNNIISMGVMLNPSYTKRRGSNANMVPLSKYPPYVPVRLPDGRWAKARDYITIGSTGQVNPFEALYDTYNYYTSMTNLGEAFVNLDIVEGLRLRISGGANISDNTTDEFTTASGYVQGVNRGSAGGARGFNLINENTLNYSKTFNDVHEFNGLLGASYQRNNTRNLTMRSVNSTYKNYIIHTLNNAIIDPNATNSTLSQWGLVSYFGRVNYAYNEKYLFSASLRTDGCSRFGSDNKWGYFPSASVAWRVSQESFMENIPSISEFKIRASYGTTGNFNIGDFDYLGRITGTSYSPNNTLTSGQTQSTFENTKLGWEKTISYDIGAELGFFNNRINIVFDYYDKRTSGLLYNVTIPAVTGFTSSLFNIGEVRNKGVELEINTKNFTGKFNWQTSFNLSSNKNEVTDLGGITERINTLSVGMAWILRLGEPMFSYYGYKMIGMLNNAADLENYPIMAGSKPGNPRLEDVNGDGVINPSDRVILGNFMPKVLMGMTNDFSWKRFDLSISMQTSLGAKVYNYEDQYYSGTSLCALRRSLSENEWWSEEEPGDGKTPARALRMTAYHASTSHFIQSASFLAVRNLNFGYTLPGTASDRIGLSNLRLYSSINNPLMIKDKGNHTYNPEGFTGGEISGTGSNPGNNQGSEPVNVVVTFGVNATF